MSMKGGWIARKKKAFNAVNFNRQKAKITNKTPPRSDSLTIQIFFFPQILKQRMILKRGTGSGEQARGTGKPNPSPIINLEFFNGKTTRYFISLFSHNIRMPVSDKVWSRFAWNCDHSFKRTSRKRLSLKWRVTYQISIHTIPPIALHIGTKTYLVWWYSVNIVFVAIIFFSDPFLW